MVDRGTMVITAQQEIHIFTGFAWCSRPHVFIKTNRIHDGAAQENAWCDAQRPSVVLADRAGFMNPKTKSIGIIIQRQNPGSKDVTLRFTRKKCGYLGQKTGRVNTIIVGERHQISFSRHVFEPLIT